MTGGPIPASRTSQRRDLHGEDLQRALYDYTKFVLEYMKERGVQVDMVQLGNELNNGFLWPDGQISGPNASGFDGFTMLLKAGIKAVRDFDPEIPIVVHLAEGGNNSLFRWFFDELVKRKVDFDIIGVSYYPYWHGTLEELSFNLNDVSQRYKKDVLVVETAYPWTLQDADGHANIFGEESLQWTAGYLATVRGQTSFLRDLIRVLKQVPDGRGLGLFYWEGALSNRTFLTEVIAWVKGIAKTTILRNVGIVERSLNMVKSMLKTASATSGKVNVCALLKSFEIRPNIMAMLIPQSNAENMDSVTST